jgi:hypothetical protein
LAGGGRIGPSSAAAAGLLTNSDDSSSFALEALIHTTSEQQAPMADSRAIRFQRYGVMLNLRTKSALRITSLAARHPSRQGEMRATGVPM